ELPRATPTEIGLDPVRLQRAYELLQQWAADDKLPAAGLAVGRKGRLLEPQTFGRQRPAREQPIRADALFLVASITKPVTVTAVMIRVERGLPALDDKVAAFVPKFAANGKQDVQIRHLMTHPSGLPDMTPNNEQLRAAHRPLEAFIEEICTIPLLFPPGTK